MAGAPCRPSRSTFHPRSRSNAWRAAARQVKCAIWHPVVKAKDADRGKSSTSLIQALATSRSEEHTSELQSLMRISYAVFCLEKQNFLTTYPHSQIVCHLVLHHTKYTTQLQIP